MDPAEWKEINALVVESALALFEACGLQLEYLGVATTEDPPFDTTLAVIGYVGSNMKGSVLLSAPDAVLSGTHPIKGTTANEDLLDWAGELTNQLLGRLKNKLRQRGVVIQMSTPMMLSALHLRISSLRVSECIAHKFALAPQHRATMGDLRVQVRFEAVIASEMHLATGQSEAPPAGEGDVLMF